MFLYVFRYVCANRVRKGGEFSYVCILEVQMGEIECSSMYVCSADGGR